jgi:hypothetical protein
MYRFLLMLQYKLSYKVLIYSQAIKTLFIQYVQIPSYATDTPSKYSFRPFSNEQITTKTLTIQQLAFHRTDSFQYHSKSSTEQILPVSQPVFHWTDSSNTAASLPLHSQSSPAQIFSSITTSMSTGQIPPILQQVFHSTTKPSFAQISSSTTANLLLHRFLPELQTSLANSFQNLRQSSPVQIPSNTPASPPLPRFLSMLQQVLHRFLPILQQVLHCTDSFQYYSKSPTVQYRFLSILNKTSSLPLYPFKY